MSGQGEKKKEWWIITTTKKAHTIRSRRGKNHDEFNFEVVLNLALGA